MIRIPPTALAALVLGASGALHGLWTGRWSAPGGLEGPVARLDRLAMEAGDWEGRPLTLDRRAVEAGGIAGYLHRRYTDRRTGKRATLLLVCGSPGPISLHEPTACYAGSGFVASPVARYVARRGPGAGSAEFRVAEFRKATPTDPQHLRIFWAWSDGGPWKAPRSPRLAFATAPALYKLYLISEADDAGAFEDDPCIALMGAMLPELEDCLAGAP